MLYRTIAKQQNDEQKICTVHVHGCVNHINAHKCYNCHIWCPLTEKYLQIQCLIAKKIPLTEFCCLLSQMDAVLLDKNGEQAGLARLARLDPGRQSVGEPGK